MPGVNTLLFSADQPGVYQLLVTNAYGCSDSDQVELRLAASMLAVPAIRISPVKCFGEKNAAIHIDSVTGGTPPMRFALNDGVFGPNSSFTNLKSGTYVIRVQDAEGCEWQSDSLYIPEPPELKIDLGADLEAALGDSMYLRVNIIGSAAAPDTIVWKPLVDPTRAGAVEQKWLPLRSGRVAVEVTDKNGCRAEDEMTYRIGRARRVYMPNVFQPGTAGNDLFLLFGGPDVAEVERLEIFDRWGEKVFGAEHFQAGDPAYGWSGMFRGMAAPPGVYAVYAVVRFVDGEKETFTGSLTLLR